MGQGAAKMAGKIASPISSVAGMAGGAATAASFVFPPMAPIAAGLDGIALGSSAVATGSKLLDGDKNTKVGMGDAFGLLSAFW